MAVGSHAAANPGSHRAAYYERFLQRFPDIGGLADAPQEEVLRYWAGLGYYSRARHLHRTAQIVARDLGGRFPATVESLSALPGIGRSTAGAIVAIAFRRRAAILDGNVKRVLARYGGVVGWPGDADTSRRLWALSEALTPDRRVDDYTQAIMDLGATVCTRAKPACCGCPVASRCVAYRENRIPQLPGKRPAKAMPTRECYFLMLLDRDGRVYLERKPEPGLWGGLWCFPEFASWEALETACRRWRGDPAALERLPSSRHTFSHYHLSYTPVIAISQGETERIADGDYSRWVDPRDVPPPMPTPIQRLYRRLNNPLEETTTHD